MRTRTLVLAVAVAVTLAAPIAQHDATGPTTVSVAASVVAAEPRTTTGAVTNGSVAATATVGEVAKETKEAGSPEKTGTGSGAPEGEGHSTNGTETGSASAEHGSAEGEAGGAEAETEALTQKQIAQINQNGLNAIYAVVSLVAVMFGCVLFSFEKEDSSEESWGLGDDLAEAILLAHGGTPEYDSDGTLKAISESKWKPPREQVVMSAHAKGMEDDSRQIVNEAEAKAMGQINDRLHQNNKMAGNR